MTWSHDCGHPILDTSLIKTFIVMITPKRSIDKTKITLVLKQRTEALKHMDQNNGHHSRGKTPR